MDKSCPLFLAALMAFATAGCGPTHGRLVRPRVNGSLIYAQADSLGNRIPDFSMAGYMGGGVRIPDVPVRIVVSPEDAGEDATERIQAAIDKAAALPRTGNFRGTVLLKAGTYRVEGTLTIPASGIVLRGQGPSPDGTVLLATGQQRRTLITVAGTGRPREIGGTRQRIFDPYVPVGSRRFCVESTTGLEVGQSVMVYRPATQEWIRHIGMDRIPERANTVQWTPEDYPLYYQRVIQAIHGNAITFDAPIVCAIDERFGGGEVFAYEFPGRISHVGVEDIRLVSEHRGEDDELHAWTGIVLDKVENAWVRGVKALHFGFGCVIVGQSARQTTIEDCAYLDPVSRLTGARRYPFCVNGQLTLVQRCTAREGRHDFATGSRVKGPNVFLDCVGVQSHSDSGPHQRWATGTLYDNVETEALNAQDRGSMGTGHGWAGAQQVFWNCRAETFLVESPPGSRNYCIGCVGRRGKVREEIAGHYESLGRHVAPRSLYLAQLRDRLDDEAVRNVSTPAQREGTIRKELMRRVEE